jgi:hypothetical protein
MQSIEVVQKFLIVLVMFMQYLSHINPLAKFRSLHPCGEDWNLIVKKHYVVFFMKMLPYLKYVNMCSSWIGDSPNILLFAKHLDSLC